METATNVQQFLDILSDNLYDRAKMDFDAMLNMKQKETYYQNGLMCWDTPYFTHKSRTQLLDVKNSDFSPYFSLGGCMEGLNMVCQELYGISMKSEEMLPGDYFINLFISLQDMHRFTIISIDFVNTYMYNIQRCYYFT